MLLPTITRRFRRWGVKPGRPVASALLCFQGLGCSSTQEKLHIPFLCSAHILLLGLPQLRPESHSCMSLERQTLNLPTKLPELYP